MQDPNSSHFQSDLDRHQQLFQLAIQRNLACPPPFDSHQTTPDEMLKDITLPQDSTMASAFNQKALHQGADPKLTYQDPAWAALQQLLRAPSSSSLATNDSDINPIAMPATVENTITVRDDHLRPSPFESPLAVSSIGSPSSSRDFGDSPLMRTEDDLVIGNDPSNIYAGIPLFDTLAVGSNNNFVEDNHQQQSMSFSSYPNFNLSNESGSLLHSAWAGQGGLDSFINATRQALNNQAQVNVNQPVLGRYNFDFGDDFVGADNVSPTDISPDSEVKDVTALGQTSSLAHVSNGANDFMLNVRRLSLSESVSGYSSSQDNDVNNLAANTMLGVPINHSGVTTPSLSSSEASPAASGASINGEPETISQLAGVFVREYARCRDEQDTSVLVRALNIAGIQVDAATLDNIIMSPFEQQTPASATDGGAPFTSAQSPASSIDAYQNHRHDFGHHHGPFFPHETVHDTVTVETDREEPRVQHHKVKSSVQGSVKKAAIGKDSAAAVLPESFWHNGKRMFRCDICHKTFDRAFNLKTHRMIHSDHREYPFACPFADCNKAFSRKADCNRHTKSAEVSRWTPSTKRFKVLTNFTSPLLTTVRPRS
ncbi:unnamed protein product [Sympodiomycopsis kandeliae]